ncbi:hypothetical protein EDI_062970 [Entamoeba dispar SAW760]|uniref:Uncharacterized protein n=1 Tax=Entamoeba dispar (strain ATCC PRA-260 / SAW760) TaxID=370354 RepID=B0EPY7_ENTDS|nr:uncharacterized protein EDI_062970 [Entamoeba dispar SAW760]EDR23399.1 hypothetical protein EDI_062970 [Entamoeba dispar SAW760]|eukprot:EDR23399.1 hypothetical protein EDI_062970 [Entamoeba dispar SAW760]
MLKNNQSNLQATLLTLLSNWRSITISKSQKIATKTEQFFKVKSITINSEEILIYQLLKNLSKEIRNVMRKQVGLVERLIKFIIEKMGKMKSISIERGELVPFLYDVLRFMVISFDE